MPLIELLLEYGANPNTRYMSLVKANKYVKSDEIGWKRTYTMEMSHSSLILIVNTSTLSGLGTCLTHAITV